MAGSIIQFRDIPRLQKEMERTLSLQERLDRTTNNQEKVEILGELKPGAYLVVGKVYFQGATERADSIADYLESAGLDIGIGNGCEFTYCTIAPKGITNPGYSAGADGFLSEIRVYRRPLSWKEVA